MTLKNQIVETFWAFDESSGDQFQFDSWSRARQYVEEAPEHRWAMKRVITEKYEEYRMPRCTACSKHKSSWNLDADGICVNCALTGKQDDE